jgi:hypothetical protein
MLAILARIAEISRQWVPIQATMGWNSGRGGFGFKPHHPVSKTPWLIFNTTTLR